MKCNGYKNWDTWNSACWILNSEAALNQVRSASSPLEAKTIIIKVITMVKYTYNECIELDKVDFNEVLESVL